MLHTTYVSGKKVPKVIKMHYINALSLSLRGSTILCFQNADLLKTFSLVSKVEVNWTNIDQVKTLCAN